MAVKMEEEKVYFEDYGKDVQEIIIELLASIVESKIKDKEGVNK